MSKKGLGRGLGALLPEVGPVEKEHEGVVELDIQSVRPNPGQPRKEFDSERLDELAASITEHGIVQPIVVRKKDDGYEIVAGERRWRGAQRAGLAKIPALVRELTESEAMEIALIENLQRADLNPLEEAEAYKVLQESFRLTQEELAKRLGKSRSQIANTLRLLQLSAPVRTEVREGRLSMGHAKVLLGVEDEALQAELARRTVVQGLSVRELESLVQASTQERPKPKRVETNPEVRRVESQLREFFGTPVAVRLSGEKGRIEITFFGDEGLNRILDALKMAEQPVSTPPRSTFRV